MRYENPPLIMEDTRVRDAHGVIELADLPDPQPQHPARLIGATPLIERLWRVALADVESNIVHVDDDVYLSGGKNFGATLFTRDIAYSGLLGLNRICPDLMRKSLRFTRKVKFSLGLTISEQYRGLDTTDIPWRFDPLDFDGFHGKYRSSGFVRRTDDVVWIWSYSNLIETAGLPPDEWQWLYDTALRCFDELYKYFHDPSDGLWRGQSSFIDVHFPQKQASGYPQSWSIDDCIRQKATSTNALYYKAHRLLARIARKLGRDAQAATWDTKAENLRAAILRELRRPDGTFALLKDRWGHLAPRREAMGTAFAVLLDIVAPPDGAAVLKDYPITDAGVPLFLPFYEDNNRCYHNLTAWPFVDTFFLQAVQKATGRDTTAQTLALLARTVRDDGFHEIVSFNDKRVAGSGHQLWTAAAFLGTCLRAGLTIAPSPQTTPRLRSLA